MDEWQLDQPGADIQALVILWQWPIDLTYAGMLNALRNLASSPRRGADVAL